MKQFLHAIPLRTVALFASFAALALPARADTLFYSGDDPWTIDTSSDNWEFEIIRGETTASQSLRATSGDGAVVKVKRAGGTTAGTTATTTLYKEPQTNPDRETDVARFALVPVAPGTTTITISMPNDQSTPDISFTVVVEGSPTDRMIRFLDAEGNPASAFVSLCEGETKTILFQPSVPLDATLSTAGWEDSLEYTVNPGFIRIKGLDGTYSCALGLSDPSGAYDATSLNILVTNQPPRISGRADPENPTILGQKILKNKLVEFKAADFLPTDATADMPKLTLTWPGVKAAVEADGTVAGNTVHIGGVFSNSWASATEEDAYELFSVTVSDGNDSYTGYYAVKVTDSVTLFTDTTAPFTALAKQGGIAQASTFDVFDSNGTSLDWELVEGTTGRALVFPKDDVLVRAILEPGTYPFGWYGDTAVLQAPNATRAPNQNLRAIVSMPEDDSATIYYFASYPYYHTVPGKGAEGIGVYEPSPLNNVLDDPFGDFDGDGLSDTWEDYWFQDGMDPTTDQTTMIPVGIHTGDYGPSGNLDGDWLPTLDEQEAPDATQAHPKGGWPYVTVDANGDPVTNRVFALKYPLDFSTGAETYNKSDAAEKPLFANFVEYRGLREDRTGGDGIVEADIVRYAPEIVNQHGTYGDRNNCAGTDPKLLDTDTDGFSDGWEWYFWSTIKYGVNAKNWRCWDPSYTYYSTASATAGYPMLETDDPLEYVFDLDPTQSYDIDRAAGTYMTFYEVSDKVLSDNGVVLPIVAGSVAITFYDSDFALYTLSANLAKYLGLNPKDENGNSRLFYMVYKENGELSIDPDTGYPVLRALEGAWVNDLTGRMYVPGWQKLSRLADTVSYDITQDTAVSISFERQNGLFPREFLLSRFDPMNWDKYLRGDIADRVAGAGMDPDNWDPTSDLDGDGVLDVEEYFLGTDPLHWDTDRDGMPDGWEVQRGLLPLDPRDKVNDCGPGDNPDEDYMAYDATGTAKHADAYRADLANEVYWNGREFTGYRPGRAVFPSPSSFTMNYAQGNRTVELVVMIGFGGGPYGNLQEFLYSFYGVTHGFFGPVYPVKGDYNWSTTTSNPCNNDTDGDGCPDGWECYVGYSPLVPLEKYPEDLMEGIGYGFDPDFLEQPPICQGPPQNPDIDFDEEADLINEFQCLWAHMMWPETVTKTLENGTEVTVKALAEYPNWYNKWMPTDPWNADTDGDGLTDYQEYTDPTDRNGDGNELCNFNPTQVDTDLDWLPDGWEWFMGTYAYEQLPNLDAEYLDDEYGPYGDPDGDKLANYQEYLTGANYGWRHDKWYPLDKESMWVPQPRTDEETQKWDPMTPWDFPYDPGLYPEYGPTVRAHNYSPVDFLTVPVSGTTIARAMETLKALETRWGYSVSDSPSLEMETLAARFQRVYEIIYNFQAARDVPVADGNPERDEFASLFLYDTDPSYDPTYNSDGFPIPGKKYFYHHSMEEHDRIVALFENVRTWIYSYAQCGYGWDLAGSLVNGGVYMPLNGNSTGYGFPGTRPRMVDSDNDGMPDYWEIYHGLNPVYGGARLIGKAGDEADADRGDKDSWGDGSTDNWIMGYDPDYVLNLNFAMRIPYAWPIARKAKVGYPYRNGPAYSFDDAIATAFGPDMMGNYIMEWGSYDLVNRPWLSGDKAADCDKDGLNNQEESYSFFANDLWSHTDPSPYWLTDMSQTVSRFGQNASHVNLYYRGSDYGDAMIWWWSFPFNQSVTDAPQYVWDFEVGEGFDTDNDNIGDREELASVSTRGKTDPQNPDSPVSRKAMYFDGHAACRTQRPFYHDQYALTSHTVEFWVRPHAYPAPGRIATFIHRPVMMPVDTLSGARAWQIRDTFHVYMDERGRVFGQVDNDGIEQAANSAVVMSAGRLILDTWTHIALVMDSRNDSLALYINGEFAGSVASALKPCTGTMMSSAYSSWFTANGGGSNGVVTVSSTTVNFDYSPAPIVVGAYEKNPWGVVGGKLWGKTETQFDENRFFDGWVDEIRIWDRCRSQTEIMNNMTKRFKPEDIEPINRRRWEWDKNNLHSTTAEADFPQKLLYHYTFDNVPDVVRAPGRNDETVFFTDTDPLPLGWEVNASIRPVPFVPWWYAADNRTTVYATDFSYVPFVENTVGHMAQRPPRDVSEIQPVYDMDTWEFLGYRYRRSGDWLGETEAVIESGGQEFTEIFYSTNVLGGGLGQSDVTYFNGVTSLLPPTLIANAMNPYGDGYNTHVLGSSEYNPWNFGGALDLYGVYEDIPVHSDMVPLLDAVADIDVPMWDGAGPGSENASIDSDGDGMPDWWEIANGLDPTDASGYNGAYGDSDNDGLDNWAEYLAQTDPHTYDTDSDGYSDYYSRPDGQSLTYGELYDDGDGMDNAWEMQFDLAPDRYDADDDADHDGWTNWEEFMAGTNPRSVTSFPMPTLSVTFDYAGASSNLATLTVLSYGRRTAGDAMGGAYDGKFSTAPNIGYGVDRFGRDGIARIGGSDFYVNLYPLGHVVDAQLTVSTDEGEAVYPLEHANDEYGMFFNDLTGMAGLVYESGTLFCSSECVGKLFQLNVTIDGYSFPVTFDSMLRKANTHLVGGYNRFIGFADQNGNGEYDVGEPMGLSRHRPTLVSWDSVGVEIPMMDELWGFPRFSWPASTNPNVTTYTIYIWNQAGHLVVPDSGIKINAPRTFIHEGDYIRSGVYGISLGTSEADTFTWSAVANNGIEEEILAEGSFVLAAKNNEGQRQAFAAKYPTQRTIVRGNVVEFEWKMDRRNAGVLFNLWKEEGGTERQIIKNMVIPLPVRHGDFQEAEGYWSAIPQMENGDRFLSLDPGQYRYTIAERPNSSMVTPGIIEERFQLENNPTNRSLYTVSGAIRYFGKVMSVDASPYANVAFAANADRTAFTATVADPATIARGAMAVLVKNGNDATEVLNDSDADGVLHPAGVEAYTAWNGVIDYETGKVAVYFAEPLAAGRTLALACKTFPAPLVLQVFSLPDGVATSTSVSGNPVYQTSRRTKGEFSIPNLVRGTYAIRGFIDSNGDGVAQGWETQGIAVKNGIVGPSLSSMAAPLVVDGDLGGLMIVLHDRDTDNDLLPDSWEWWKLGGKLSVSGYQTSSAGGLAYWQEYADGALDSDPRTPDTDLDGLTDAMEILVTGTDTHLRDTDGDGVGDLEEFLAGSDPLSPGEAVPYAIPALAFDENGVPYVDIAYPALRPGIVLTYELQRKLSLGEGEVWETVASFDAANDDGAVFYTASDGVNDHLSEPGTARMRPADQAEGVDFTTGFYRVKIYADYGKMVDNGDGTWSYWTWLRDTNGSWSFHEAVRGEGTLVRDADGNWRFVDPETKQESGSLYRDPDGDWKFVK